MALLGGVAIGLAAGAMLLWNGRIAGISGIFNGLMRTDTVGDRDWRVLFVAGLLTGGLILWFVNPAFLPFDHKATGGTQWSLVILAGLLVGFGAKLGNGCTSGHGVCGVARRSPRSLLATTMFIVVGMATVFASKHILGV
jgi:uncharacterized membrane protein YedE/YeeE